MSNAVFKILGKSQIQGAWVHFINTQTSIFRKAITTIENQTAFVFDAIDSMEVLNAPIWNKTDDNFITINVKKRT